MKWQLALICSWYLDAWAAGDHPNAIQLCSQFGSEAGRRVVAYAIPHPGYWFEA